MKLLSSKLFRLTFLSIILFEELSFLGFLYQPVNRLFFLIFVLIVFFIALWRLEYAVFIVLLELLIGSKGYLFFIDIGDNRISLRIAIWSIVMLVWFAKLIIKLFRGKKNGWSWQHNFSSARDNYPFFLLAIFIAWGTINGLIFKTHAAGDVFFDLNGWLYFLFVFPMLEVFSSSERLDRFLELVYAALAWLATKTFFLFFVFSHFTLESPAYRLYRWVRVSGVGEITQINGGFYRVFFQSQIYLLIVYLACFLILAERAVKNRFKDIWLDPNSGQASLAMILILPAIFLSLSRSFWLGLAFGLIAVITWLTAKNGIIKIIRRLPVIISIWLINVILAALLIAGLAIFPVPPALGGFNAASVLNARFSDSDAAAVSRWQLLPKLWQGIKEQPILGKGFGATITYESSDPRQLALPTKGIYTTYTFEWGWLDIWLKLGIFGLLSYLYLIWSVLNRLVCRAQNYRQYSNLYICIAFGLLALSVVHFTSPYLNHPLGIGFLLFSFVI